MELERADARDFLHLRGMKVTTPSALAHIHDRAAVSESWRTCKQCNNVVRDDQINGIKAVMS